MPAPRGEQHSPSGRTNTTVSRGRIPWAPPGMCPQSMGGHQELTGSARGAGGAGSDLLSSLIFTPAVLVLGASLSPASPSRGARGDAVGAGRIRLIQARPASPWHPGSLCRCLISPFSSGEIPRFFQFMHRPECVCATLGYFCPISSVHDHFPLIPPCSSSWREILPNQDLVLNPLRNPLIQLD